MFGKLTQVKPGMGCPSITQLGAIISRAKLASVRLSTTRFETVCAVGGVVCRSSWWLSKPLLSENELDNGNLTHVRDQKSIDRSMNNRGHVSIRNEQRV